MAGGGCCWDGVCADSCTAASCSLWLRYKRWMSRRRLGSLLHRLLRAGKAAVWLMLVDAKEQGAAC